MERPSRPLTARARRKALGAFYTAEPVAQYLVEWALQAPDDSVLDPSFGGGVFLRAAAARLKQLGGRVTSICGVELDREVHAQVSAELEATGSALSNNLYCADFFALTPAQLGPFNSLVGNPPFIRAARMNVASRELALARAAAQGVRLSKRCSAWAPFVVHASAFVKPGGRLALVVPAELGHAVYARAVLRHLTRSFARVTLLSPRERLFPDLDQETLLLLAEGRGEADSRSSLAVGQWSPTPSSVHPQCWGGQREGGRLVSALLPERIRDLYRELAVHPRVRRLGALAEVGIGYVTGANRFFHLSPASAAHWELPSEVLRPAVWRSRALVGLRLLPQDWRQACASDTAGYLLQVDGYPRSEAVARYLAYGEASGVAQGYKTRERRCWYCVNNVKVPDLLLAAMGLQPVLAVNEARVTVPNTLHMVRLYPYTQTTALDLSLGWQTALTRLSLEVEGHALGGGLLKLEPNEAKQVLVALPDDAGLEPELDRLLRQRHLDGVLELTDRVMLQDGLGLTRRECSLLREGYYLLRERRLRKGRRARAD